MDNEKTKTNPSYEKLFLPKNSVRRIVSLYDLGAEDPQLAGTSKFITVHQIQADVQVHMSHVNKCLKINNTQIRLHT